MASAVRCSLTRSACAYGPGNLLLTAHHQRSGQGGVMRHHWQQTRFFSFSFTHLSSVSTTYYSVMSDLDAKLPTKPETAADPMNKSYYSLLYRRNSQTQHFNRRAACTTCALPQSRPRRTYGWMAASLAICVWYAFS